MIRETRHPLFGTLTLAMVLAACGGASGAPASSGAGGASAAPNTSTAPSSNATLTIAVGVTPNTLDPISALGPELNPTSVNVYEPLFKVNDKKQVVGNTAAKYEASADGLTATITLKPNVTFQDGTPLDGEAVKANLQRGADLKLHGNDAPYFKVIKSVDVVNPTTVKLNLSAPSPVLPFILTTNAAGMVSPTSLKTAPNTYEKIQQPVGTGPFAFKEYVAGDHATMQRYDKYWGAKPYYKTLTYRFVPEDNTRESLLLAKQVDVITAPPFTDIASLQGNKTVKVAFNTSQRDIVVSIDTQWPGLTDVRVRQALNYAVDKEAALKAALYGQGEILQSPTSQAEFGACAAGSYAYDANKAKQLLQDAGAANLSLPMSSPTGRYPQDFQTAQIVANYLKAVGVDAKLDTMAWPALLAKIVVPPDKASYPLELLGYGGTTVDASSDLREFTKSTWPPNGVAMNYFTSPDTEKLYQEQAVDINPTTRAQKLCDMSKAVWNAAPWLFLWNPKYPMAYQASLDGLAFDKGDAEQFLLAGVRPAK